MLPRCCKYINFLSAQAKYLLFKLKIGPEKLGNWNVKPSTILAIIYKIKRYIKTCFQGFVENLLSYQMKLNTCSLLKYWNQENGGTICMKSDAKTIITKSVKLHYFRRAISSTDILNIKNLYQRFNNDPGIFYHFNSTRKIKIWSIFV